VRLRRCNPDRAGISRRRRGSGFSYLDAEGNVITDRQVVERLRALAVPLAAGFPHRGAATLLRRDVCVRKGLRVFDFTANGGVHRTIELADESLGTPVTTSSGPLGEHSDAG
jgi:DNA topoisomerase IB